MIKYVFKDEDFLPIKNASKADPQKIGEALAIVQAAHNGELIPEHVVNAAKDTKNPLHAHFEWNDKVAAHNYRVDQARQIIRLIRVEDTVTHEQKPAWISVSDGGVSYRAVAEVESSTKLQLAVLRQAQRDLQAFEARYKALKDICAQVKVARERIDQQIDNLETRAAA